MNFAEELTEECFQNEYWKSLSMKVLNNNTFITDKEYNDLKRFIDILTTTEHKDANAIAYKVMSKLKEDLNNDNVFKTFELSINANLTRYEDFNFEFTDKELELIPIERRIQIS